MFGRVAYCCHRRMCWVGHAGPDELAGLGSGPAPLTDRNPAPGRGWSMALGLQHFCDAGCDAADRPVVDRWVGDGLADLFGDGRRDALGGTAEVIHAPAGTVAGQPVGYVEGLLEMMAEREVEEGPVAGHEFHGRRQPALDDC